MSSNSQIIPSYVYTNPEDKNSLFQGDLIEVKGPILAKFKEYYPSLNHDEGGKYIMVLTQSCDLVRRLEGKKISDPNCSHVLVCVVRPAVGVIGKEVLFKGVKCSMNGYTFLNQSAYKQLQISISRLINNSESKYLFFLPKMPQIHEDLIAVLSVSYPFRCETLYQDMIEHRVATLLPEFRAKIGYMLADLYGRVATTDLFEHNWTEDHLISKAEQILKNAKIVNGHDENFIKNNEIIKFENVEAINEEVKDHRTKLEAEKIKPTIDHASRSAQKKSRKVFMEILRNQEELNKLQKLNEQELSRVLDDKFRLSQ